MGILNITPDSFSDGDQYNTLMKVEDQFQFLLREGAVILDVGAESTAPFNSKIDAKEELERFEKLFFPLLSNSDLKSSILSIDTYKSEVFEEVYKEIRKNHPNIQIVWNDVSGCIDDNVLEVLGGKCPDSHYIFCHNLVSERGQASDHMQFCRETLTFEDVCTFFKEGLKKLSDFQSRVLLDPCFGFSKSFEQNWQLFRDIPKLQQEFPPHLIVVGISRKSMLKKVSSKYEVDLELMHASALSSLRRELNPGPIVYRLHDPKVFHSIFCHQNL